MKSDLIFRLIWWICNLLLAAAFVGTLWSGIREISVRPAAWPFHGAGLRPLLNRIFPKWDENTEPSLLLERKSFFVFFLSTTALLFLMVLRLPLGWIADYRLRIPRFHLRANLSRATAAFFSTPEIK